MGAFLAKLGPTGIRTLIMLMGGVPVDSLKADVQTLRKLAGVRIPRVLRSAIVKALGGCSWFALLGVFRWACSRGGYRGNPGELGSRRVGWDPSVR